VIPVDGRYGSHAESKTFEHGGEVPGIDCLAVDRGLAADGVEPGAVHRKAGKSGWPASAWSSRASAAAACARAPRVAFHPRRIGRASTGATNRGCRVAENEWKVVVLAGYRH
jgi:hypothetical protein